MEENKGQSRKLNVKTLSNSIFSLTIPPSIPIKDLKIEIEKVSSVPVDRQRLIYMGKVLKDEDLLTHYITEDDQTIHLMAKVSIEPSAPPPPSSQPQPNLFGFGFGFPPNAQVIRNNPQNGNVFIRAVSSDANLQNLSQTVNNLLGNIMGPGGLGGLVGEAQNSNQTSNNNARTGVGAGAGLGGAGSGAGIGGVGVGAGVGAGVGFGAGVGAGMGAGVGAGAERRDVQEPGSGENPIVNVANMGSILNRLMGEQSAFPGPSLPRLNVFQSSLYHLANYLTNYSFQLQRGTPFINRLSDLLLRETLMINPGDRQQTQFLARRIGEYLEELNNATRPLVNLLKNLELGDVPNRFRILDVDLVGQRLFDQNSQNQLNNYLNPHPNNVRIEQEISISIASGNIGPTATNNLNQNSNSSNQNVNIPLPQNNALNNFFDIQSIIGNLANPLSGSNQASSSAQTGSRQPANPPLVIPLPQNCQTIPRPENLQGLNNNNPINLNAANPSNANPLSSLLGTLSREGGSQNMMELTLRNLIMDNYANQLEPGDEEMLSMFGSIKLGEIVTSFVAHEYSFLDRQHTNIRQGLIRILEKYENNKSLLASKMTAELGAYFSPSPSLLSLFFEGFSPTDLAKELLNKNLLELFDLILKDHEGSSFQTEFIKAIRRMFGEVAYEISEGMKGGINDFEIMVKENMGIMVEKLVGREAAGLVSMFLMQNAVTWIRKVYEDYREANAQKNDRMEEEKIDHNEQMNQQDEENKLLDEIEEQIEKDKKVQSEIDKTEKLSEAYLKGDINFKNQ